MENVRLVQTTASYMSVIKSEYGVEGGGEMQNVLGGADRCQVAIFCVRGDEW
jgi:hypothetical protein